MRRNFYEWKSVRRLLTKDLYIMTPWHHELDREDRTAFAYEDGTTGDGLLLAFRYE